MRTVNKALFLDLDGTVIVTKSGRTFAKDKDDWMFNQNILAKIEEYVDKGYYLMIVSNQGGIEMGYTSLNDFRQKLRKVVNDIIVHTGIPFSRVGHRFSVTNNPEDFFRKPNPGMAYDLALAYILNLKDCIMVGDASGKVRKSTTVYYDEGSPTSWSHKNGTHITEQELKKLNVFNTEGNKYGTIVEQDFSDSDYQFALNAGMVYVDIEGFLRGEY